MIDRTESEAFRELLEKSNSIIHGLLPEDRALLAIGVVSLDAETSTAHGDLDMRSLSDMHWPVVQSLVESTCEAAALNCLQGLGEEITDADASPGRVEQSVADKRTRNWLLVAEEVDPTVRFIYYVAFGLDESGFVIEIACLGHGGAELTDMYYADGTHVFIQIVEQAGAVYQQSN